MAKRDLEFLFEIGSFRFIQRMWKRFLNPDFQNNTEHSFRVTWIALLLSKMEKAGDHEKIMKMALMHDLAESRTNDVDYLSRQYVIRNEDLAMQDIFKETLLADFLDLWSEYEKKVSIEAKIVKDADNLDVDLELREQTSKGFDIDKYWKAHRINSIYPRLYTKSAKKLWKEIEKSNLCVD